MSRRDIPLTILFATFLIVTNMGVGLVVQARPGGGGRPSGGSVNRGSVGSSGRSANVRQSGNFSGNLQNSGNFGSRPTTRPSNPSTATRPSNPGTINRPSNPGTANRPSNPGTINRPGTQPGGDINRTPGNITNVGNRTPGNINSGSVTNRGGNTVNNISGNEVNIDRTTNINRNTAVNTGGAWRGGGWYGGGYYVPPGWGWGAAAFAGGLAIGAAINSAPPYYTNIYVGGNPYIYSDGVYLTQQGSSYIVVAPPVGAVVSYLPEGCQAFTQDGSQYFDCSGVIYQPYYDSGALAYMVVGGGS
ncbi:DUF6515 family protein [Thermosynechococcaceae cyanobacterium BACA0444]|uniref:DUF6515 family protein n=1 Tax=Pseudocalidococcus azoricus BACA0444 TaxID=2918990 RepID=A0AAE4FTB1_9CYAN|nr:DUF6515 family protein [Pseudocalidococcus azoricus]MDS3861781.1 DUF6515 family protein [Pseudocalidococcus azoricus BACA0444]